MSRIGNKINSGYIATQEIQLDLLNQIIEFQGETNIIDTCCGTGAALRQLTQNNQSITTYGVEIDGVRGGLAEAILDHCTVAPIESMLISNNAFGMVFLNPPYDLTLKGYGGTTERKEAIELERATRYLAPNGLMVFIVPIYRISDPRIARYLATNFLQPTVARFSDENYADYKQVAFIGYKKSAIYKGLDEDFYNSLLEIESNERDLPTLADMAKDAVEKGFTWSVPDTSHLPIRTFATRLVNASVISEAISDSEGLSKFLSASKPRNVSVAGKKAPLPLTSNQIAMLMAAGAINGMVGEGPDLHLLMGAEVVGNVTEKEKTETGTIIKVRTKRDIAIKVITPNGDVIRLMEVGAETVEDDVTA